MNFKESRSLMADYIDLVAQTASRRTAEGYIYSRSYNKQLFCDFVRAVTVRIFLDHPINFGSSGVG